MSTVSRHVSAPRGAAISCKGWPQEAALRMLMNNLDPEVAERPDDLIVYGGSGKAARSWPAFDAIVATLRRLDHDETLLVQSGKPVAVFRTHPWAPRVIIANSLLVPAWATWDVFRDLEDKGLTMYGQMTAGSWIYIGTQGILQGTYETLAEVGRRHFGGSLAGRLGVTAGLGGVGQARFDSGNKTRAKPEKGGVAEAFRFPAFVPEYIRPLFCPGKGPFRWAALSGDPADIAATDRLALELFAGAEPLCRWIRLASERVAFQGLPARICWLGDGARPRLRPPLHNPPP